MALAEKNPDSDLETLQRGADYLKLDQIRATALLDTAVLRRLSRRSAWAFVLRMGFDYGLIAAVATLCEIYWHPLLYLLAVMTIGGRQVGIGSVALHDGVHRLLDPVVEFPVAQELWLANSHGQSP